MCLLSLTFKETLFDILVFCLLAINRTLPIPSILQWMRPNKTPVQKKSCPSFNSYNDLTIQKEKKE